MRNRLHLFLLVLFLIISSIFIFYFVYNNSTSTGPSDSYASANRGITGDLWADVIIGQPNFNEGMPYERVSNKVFNPGGVFIDKSTKPNRVYIADGGNSRILAYESLGKCSNDESLTCTDDIDCGGSVCNLISRKDADKVIGQPDFSSGSCNGDASFTTFPVRSTPTNSSLCLMPQSQISPTEGGQFISMDADLNHNLYVPDPLNNRVLMYKDPFGPKNNGAGDVVADAVWGQDNFTNNLCNKGRGFFNPSNDSLCIADDYTFAFTSGVDIDPQGNLWVTDTQNKRVVRFPFDEILGRPSNIIDIVFDDSINPGAVKVHPDGTVFVLDTYYDHPQDDGVGRILKYTPPLVSQTNGVDWGDPQKPFNLPTGIEFSNDGQSVWISDTLNHMVTEWNLQGTEILNVLYKDSWSYNSGYQDLPCYPMANNTCYQDDTRGSIGMTSNGDLFLSSSSNNQDVIRFKAPIRKNTLGNITSSDFRLFNPPDGPNVVTHRSFDAPLGIEAINNQLIVADSHRLMFWNNANALTNNWPFASGVIGSTGPSYIDPIPYGRIKADSKNRLYVMHSSQIEVFKLPLYEGSRPFKSIGLKIKDLNGIIVDLSANGGNYDAVGDVFPSPNGDFLWVANSQTNRVVRIRNPLSEDPRIDIVLGQNNSNDNLCNLGKSVPTNSTLCNPGSVTMDKLGNLFVADGSLEDQGNKRLLRFDRTKIPLGNNNMKYAKDISADGVYFYVDDSKRYNTLQPLFDSSNRLIVGFNPYSVANANHSIEYFNDVQTNNWQTPTGIFKDYLMFPYAMDFDEEGNLYVADMNRYKVLKYFKPFANTSVPCLKLKDQNGKIYSDSGNVSVLDLKKTYDFTPIYVGSGTKPNTLTHSSTSNELKLNEPLITKYPGKFSVYTTRPTKTLLTSPQKVRYAQLDVEVKPQSGHLLGCKSTFIFDIK